MGQAQTDLFRPPMPNGPTAETGQAGPWITKTHCSVGSLGIAR
jgi:hypothetical protein